MDIEQARQISQDETTPPRILSQLAKSEDYITRQNVAANPNTSTEILLNLGGEFPSEVMSNPIIPLLLLENPHIFSCEIYYDFDSLINLTDIELKRLVWIKAISFSNAIE